MASTDRRRRRQPAQLACGCTPPRPAARRRSLAATAGGSSGWRAPPAIRRRHRHNLPDDCIKRAAARLRIPGRHPYRPTGAVRAGHNVTARRHARRPGTVPDAARTARAGLTVVPARRGTRPANRTELEPVAGRWPGPSPATHRETAGDRGRPPPTCDTPAASNYRTLGARGTFNQVPAGSQDEAPGRLGDHGPRAGGETSRPARWIPVGSGAGRDDWTRPIRQCLLRAETPRSKAGLEQLV